MTDIRWTDPALRDLRAISQWLTHEASPEIAAATLTRIGERIEFLGRFPHGGRPVASRAFRVLRVPRTPYLILNRLTADEVGILRLRHEREYWQTPH